MLLLIAPEEPLGVPGRFGVSVPIAPFLPIIAVLGIPMLNGRRALDGLPASPLPLPYTVVVVASVTSVLASTTGAPSTLASQVLRNALLLSVLAFVLGRFLSGFVTSSLLVLTGMVTFLLGATEDADVRPWAFLLWRESDGPSIFRALLIVAVALVLAASWSRLLMALRIGE